MKFVMVGCVLIVGVGAALACARAQPIPIPPPPPPVFNPSFPYPHTVPQPSYAPATSNAPNELPALGSRPGPCSVLSRRPCFPNFLPPIGQDLQLTIVSTDKGDPGADDAARAGPGADEPPLDTISQMFAALRACWVPPPKDLARQGMEYTVRFAFKRDGNMLAPPRVTYSSHDAPAQVREVYRQAVNAALTRCTPLRFSEGMGGAIAGRPIAIRFVDDRTISDRPSPQ